MTKERKPNLHLRNLMADTKDKVETGPEDWMDKWGACKICQGEIPYGHARTCVIIRYETEIMALKAGECRFNCRTKSAMWKAGFCWGFVKAHNFRGVVGDQDTEVEYNKWEKCNGQTNRKDS